MSPFAAFFGLPVAWILLSGATVGDPVASKCAEALRLFELGAFDQALQLYRDAQLERPDEPALNFNVGNSLFKQGDLESFQELSRAENGRGHWVHLPTLTWAMCGSQQRIRTGDCLSAGIGTELERPRCRTLGWRSKTGRTAKKKSRAKIKTSKIGIKSRGRAESGTNQHDGEEQQQLDGGGQKSKVNKTEE